MSDGSLKSAYELAMERLRRKDSDEGATETRLSDAQKAAIAEARSVCEARIAEAKILHASRVAAVMDPAEREALEQELRRETQRLADERDRRIARIRAGEA